MVKNKKIMILAISIILLFGLSAINATDISNNDTTTVTTDTNTYQTSNDDNIQPDTVPEYEAPKETTKTINKHSHNNTKKVSYIENYTDLYDELTQSTDNDVTIDLSNVVYNITDHITLNPDITSLTIEGNGAIIDGGITHRFLNIEHQCTVELRDLTIQNCYSTEDFGAVYQADGKLTIENTNFTRNTMEPRSEFGGAAITFMGTELNIIDSVFDSNELKNRLSFGGAIYYSNLESTNKLNITGSKFISNKITNKNAENGVQSKGGAIYYASHQSSPGELNISDSIFELNGINAGSSHGGVIFIKNIKQLSINNSNFTQNNLIVTQDYGVEALGGVICYYNDILMDTNVIIEDSNFLYNGITVSTIESSSARGGVLYYHPESDGSFDYGLNFSVMNSNFTENSIIVNGPPNSQTNTGGAISITGAVDEYEVNIYSSNFIDNNINTYYDESSSDSYGEGSYGGALHLELKQIDQYKDVAGEIKINNVNFTRNSLNEFIGSTNGSGGAVNIVTNVYKVNPLQISNSNFVDNSINVGYDSIGGAVNIYGNFEVNLSSNNFTRNRISANQTHISFGGAINVNNAHNLNILETVFDENTIDAKGSSDSSHLEFYGGAVYFNSHSFNTDIDLTVKDSNFTKNGINAYSGYQDAAGHVYGGALYYFYNPQDVGLKINFKIEDSTFQENTVTANCIDGTIHTKGGALLFDTSTHNYPEILFTVIGTNFTRNNIVVKLSSYLYEANNYGGAVSFNSLTHWFNVDISDSNFIQNSIDTYLNLHNQDYSAVYESFGGALDLELPCPSTAEDNFGNINIENVNFTWNSINNRMTPIKGSGGAVNIKIDDAPNISLNIRDSVFMENFIDGNYEAYGGAVNLEGDSRVTIQRTNFTQNRINTNQTHIIQGGAIRIDKGYSLNIEESVFDENTIDAKVLSDNNQLNIYGGAIYFKTDVDTSFTVELTITDSNFTQNGINAYSDQEYTQVEAYGGAVYYEVNEQRESLTVTLNLEDSSFQDNTITATSMMGTPNAKGGAIYYNDKGHYIYPELIFTVRNTDFTRNNLIVKGLSSYDGISAGGAVSIESDTKDFEVSINSSGFIENTITTYLNSSDEYSSSYPFIYGGALHLDLNNHESFADSTINLDGVNFAWNSINSRMYLGIAYGGAVNIKTSFDEVVVPLEISGSVFMENSIDGNYEAYGGAVNLYGNLNVTIRSTNFTQNRINSNQTSISQGGAVRVENAQNLKIFESVFEENTINSKNTLFSNSVDVYGGAVYFKTGTYMSISENELIIKDSNFTQNIINAYTDHENTPVNVYGGALYYWEQIQGDSLRVKILIEDSSFRENAVTSNSVFGMASAYGGAIFYDGVSSGTTTDNLDLNITGTNFTHNSITVKGGTDSNYNDISGGAVRLTTSSNYHIVSIANSNFIENSINGYSNDDEQSSDNGEGFYGGALTLELSVNAGSSEPGQITIDNVNFIWNSVNHRLAPEVGNGGALRITLGYSGDNSLPLEIINSNFRENSINGVYNAKGGAITLEGQYDLNIDGTNFTQNRITSNMSKEIYGGAVYIKDTVKIKIENSIFEENSINAKNSLQSGVNIYGGALYFEDQDGKSDYNFTIKASNFTRNGINTYDDKENTNVNTYGGAVYYKTTANFPVYLTIEDSCFTENTVTAHSVCGTADAAGGALCMESASAPDLQIIINRTNFTQNSVAIKGYDIPSGSTGGGAVNLYIPVRSLDVKMENSNFIENSLNMYLYSEEIEPREDLLRYGGALNLHYTVQGDGSQITIENVNFTWNSINSRMNPTSASGGAINVNPGDEGDNHLLNISNSNFQENSLNGHYYAKGGALNVEGPLTIIINGTNFTQNKITSNKGYNLYGGAIRVYQVTMMNITDSVFRENAINTKNADDDKQIIVYGGAIYQNSIEKSRDGNLTIERTLFADNGITVTSNSDQLGYGGAIYFEGYDGLQINETNFTKNKVNIKCTDEENQHTINANGGAIYAYTQIGLVLIDQSKFTKNSVSSANIYDSNSTGGAIYIVQIGEHNIGLVLDVYRTSFIENSAESTSKYRANSNGGAIYLPGEYTDLRINIHKTQFTKNSVTATGLYETNATGGAISSSNSINVTESTFSLNTATALYGGEYENTDDNGDYNGYTHSTNAYGGAIYLDILYEKVINMEKTTFTENSVTASSIYGADAAGGALFSKSQAKDIITINETNFTLNTANAINTEYFNLAEQHDSPNIGNEEYSVNATGGAIFIISNGELSIEKTQFTKNSATAESENCDSYATGGALYYEIIGDELSSSLKVLETNFTLNTATSINNEETSENNGGSIPLSLAQGGAIYTKNDYNNYGAIIEVSNFKRNSAMAISNNLANATGGALFITGEGSSLFNITNTNFTQNSATSDGTDNYATGGAINVMGNYQYNFLLTNSTFTKNTANIENTDIEDAANKVNGGAIYNNGLSTDNFNLIGNEFRNNTPENFIISETNDIILDRNDNHIPGNASVEVYLDDEYLGNATLDNETEIPTIKNFPEQNGKHTYKLVITTNDENPDKFQENIYYVTYKTETATELKSTNITLEYTPNENIMIGDTITITGNFTDEDGENLNIEDIHLYINDEEVEITATNDGGFTCEFITNSTNYYILAVFEGNNTYMPSINRTSFNATRIPTRITLSAENTVANENYTITINVEEIADATNNLPCNVTIIVNNETFTRELSGSAYQFNYTPTIVGENTIIVIYDGNNTHNSSMNKTSFTVTKRESDITAASTTDGETVNITFTVTDNYAHDAINEGLIYVYENNNIIKSYEFNEDNQIISINDLTSGIHNLDIVYMGNDTYYNSTYPLSITILPKAEITVEITNHTKGNVTITYTATVDGQPVNADTELEIKLPNGTTIINKTNNQGKITITDPTVTPGNHNTTATIATTTNYRGNTTTKEVYVTEDLQPLLDELEEAKQNITELKENITKLQEELEANMTALENNITALENNITALEEARQNITELQQNLTDALNNITSLEDKISELEGNITNLTDALNRNITALDEAKQNITNLQQNLTDALNNITELQNNITQLQENLDANISALNDNITALQQAQQNITELQNNLTEAQSKISELEGNITDLTDALNRNITALDEAKQNITNLQQNLTDALNNITELQNNITQLQENLDANISALNDNITALQQAQQNITELQNNLTEAQDKISELEGNITNLTDALNRNMTALEEARQNITELENNLTEAQDKISELEGNITDLTDALDRNMTALEEARQNITELENNLTEAQDKISELEGNITNLTDALNRNITALNEAKQNITELENNLTEAQDKISELEGNITDLTDALNRNITALNEAKQNITNLQQNLTDALNNITELQNNITQLQENLDANISALNDNITALQQAQQNITELQNNLTEAEGKISELEGNITDLTDALDRNITALNEAKQNITNLQQNLTDALNNITELENNITNLTNALNASITALEQAQEENQQLRNNLTEAQKTVEDLTQDLQDANEEIENLKQNITQAQETINNLNNTNKALNETVNNLTQQLDNAKDTIDNLNQSLNDANKEIRNLTDQLNSTNKKLEDLTKQLEESNNKNEQLTRELEATKQEVKDLEDKLKDAQQNINKLNNTINNLEKQVKDLEDTLDKLNKTSVMSAVPNNGTVGDNDVFVKLDNKLGTPISDAPITVKNSKNETVGTGKTDSNGLAVIPVNTKNGTENLTISYSGDNKYTPANITVSTTTTKHKVVVLLDPVTGVIGEDITLTAHVTDAEGNPVSGGNLVFKLNGKTLRNDGRFDSNAPAMKFKVTNGIVTITIKADLYLRNAKNLTASYSGNYKYDEAKGDVVTAQIKKRNAEITVTSSPSTQKQYETITFTAKLKDTTPNYKNTTMIYTDNKVMFKVNGKTVKDANGKVLLVNVDNNATASYKYTIPAGMSGITNTGVTRNYTVEAVLVSDNYYPDTRNNSTFHVERSPTTINIQKVTVNNNNQLSIKAEIKDYKGNNVIGDTDVNIKINGKTYVNPNTNKTQNFKVAGGKIDLSNIQVSKDITIKRVMIVTGNRQAYLGQNNETTSIVKV